MDEIRRRFDEYVKPYGLEDEKIRIKVIHTYEVDKVMAQLTENLGIDEHMAYLAHVTAIYHDIGRFEQVRRFGTYLDQYSVDHAKYGTEIILDSGLLDFLGADDRKKVVAAVRNHNRYEIEEGLDERTRLLCHLIRDADKCDIFRVFAEEDVSAIVGNSMEDIERQQISDRVFETFMAGRPILKADRKTNLDIWVGYIAFFFDMYFDETVAMMKKDGRYRKRFDEADFKDEKTRERTGAILARLEEYIEDRIG